jgi:dihydroorotase
MSKFITLGMPLAQVIASATVNAARVFPALDDRGTLNIGAPADVAIMELRELRSNSRTITRGRAPATSGSFP